MKTDSEFMFLISFTKSFLIAAAAAKLIAQILMKYREIDVRILTQIQIKTVSVR